MNYNEFAKVVRELVANYYESRTDKSMETLTDYLQTIGTGRYSMRLYSTMPHIYEFEQIVIDIDFAGYGYIIEF